MKCQKYLIQYYIYKQYLEYYQNIHYIDCSVTAFVNEKYFIHFINISLSPGTNTQIEIHHMKIYNSILSI